MKLSKNLLAFFAIFAFVASMQTANGQETVNSTGTVLEPISYTSSTNLAFGTSIFPGNDVAVTPQATGASQFDIDGETGKEVTLNFTLPENLTHIGDGSSTLPISFSATDGVFNTAMDVSGLEASAFDPKVANTTTLGGTSGLLFVWLGGTVAPSNTQTEGAYSADIVLDVVYTGN